MKIIIGGSGYIGTNLSEHLKKNGETIVGTCYRNPRKGLLYFDLENPDLSNLGLDLDKVDRIIIASAIHNINECKTNKERSYRINVDGTKKLIEQSIKYHITPVFLSSDCVFDGKKGNYSESDMTNPCNNYGAHKKIIEDFLLQSREDFFIARLSKVFGVTPGDKTFLASWALSLKKGDTISCAIDQRICPTYINDLVRVLDIAFKRNLKGLYNIASPESYCRLDLARMLQSELCIETGKIIPCYLRDLNLLDPLPQDVSMNTEKIQKDTGFRFTPMKNCLSELKSSFNFYLP